MLTYMARTLEASAAAVFVGIAAVMIQGCASVDPWGEFQSVPASRSQSFGAETVGDEHIEAGPPELTNRLSGQMITLADCVRIALEHNPHTAESWQTIRGAAARAGRAKADYLPTIGFSSSASRGDEAELNGQADRGTQNRYDAIFGLRWLLWDGGGREARVDAAAAEVLATGFRHNTVLQDVALDVVEAYYGLLAARSFRELAADTVRQRDYQLRLAKARHDAGVVAKSDVLKAEAEKAAADLELVRAKHRVHVTQGRLANTMGLRVSLNLQIQDAPPIDRSAELADVEALLHEAARNRAELKAALALVRTQEASVRIAESRYWPTISLDTSFGWLGRTFLPSQRQWSVGADLDLPLWTGFDRNYQLHGNKADLARAVAVYQAVLQGVELEVWTAYWQTVEAGQAIEAARRFVASAEESARVAEGEYKSGTGSIIGLIDAQTARTAARDRLIQAQLDWRTARARFRHSAGRLLTEAVGRPTEKGSKRP